MRMHPTEVTKPARVPQPESLPFAALPIADSGGVMWRCPGIVRRDVLVAAPAADQCGRPGAARRIGEAGAAVLLWSASLICGGGGIGTAPG